MRPEFAFYIFLFICAPLLLFAGNEIQYSPDYVDPATGLSLTELWKQAVLRNPEIQAANRRVLEAKALRKQAAAFPNPELQIYAGTSSILGEPGDREWGTGIAQKFELGGKRGKRIRAAEISTQIAEQELREKERQVRWELQQAFAETLATAANIHTTQEAFQLNEQSHQITLARVREGETAAVEQAVSEVELNRLKVDLATLRAEGARAFSKIRILTGSTEPLRIRAAKDWPVAADWNADEFVSVALESRPDFKLVLLQTELSRTEIALAKAEAVSDLDAYVEYSNERSAFDQFGLDASGNRVALTDQDRNLSAGLSIQIPVFNRNQGNVQAAQARGDAAQIRSVSMENSIRQEILVAVERLKTAESNFLMFQNSILNQSEKELEVLQASYRAGEFRFFDLINEQRRALEIRKSYIHSAREYFIALAEMEFVIASNVTGEVQ